MQKNIYILFYLALHPWKINLRDSKLKISLLKSTAFGIIIAIPISIVLSIIFSQFLISIFGNNFQCLHNIKRLGCDPNYQYFSLIIGVTAGGLLGFLFGFLRKKIE